jgi:hypothetical protein
MRFVHRSLRKHIDENEEDHGQNRESIIENGEVDGKNEETIGRSEIFICASGESDDFFVEVHGSRLDIQCFFRFAL